MQGNLWRYATFVDDFQIMRVALLDAVLVLLVEQRGCV